MTALVFGVIRAFSMSAVSRNPFSAVVFTGTHTPPANATQGM